MHARRPRYKQQSYIQLHSVITVGATKRDSGLWFEEIVLNRVFLGYKNTGIEDVSISSLVINVHHGIIVRLV